MKYSVQHWDKQDDNILYFFQRLEEMLFHYSSDIVRMPIHNIRTLIKEYLHNEKEKKAGHIQEYQLEQIMKEMKFALKNDSIIRDCLGEDFINGIIEELSSQKVDVIRYINNKFNDKIYLNWCIEYIIKHAYIHSHKDEIDKGLKSWLVEIVSWGYSPEYIYNYLNKFLSVEHPKAKNALNEFLGHFTIKTKKYRVFFVFTFNMITSKEILKKRLGICFDDDGNFSRIRKRNKDFIGYIDVDAFDKYGAIGKANSKISVFLKFYRVVSNRKRALVRNMGAVKNFDSDELSFITLTPEGYRSIEIEPNLDITNFVDSMILNCQTKPNDTVIQIYKIIDLHNEALQQLDLKDGFLNLWSILEVVSDGTFGTSKVDKVLNSVIPILKKDYMHEVLNNIDDDLKDNLDDAEYNALIESIKDKDKYSIGDFIFLPEFESLREEYFLKLDRFPNIRTKIYRLYLLRNDKSQINKLSDKYAQRIKWHIYRLYRARNSIVHSGETPDNIQRLGEHLHIYVDRILLEILMKLAKESSLTSVSDILIDTRLLVNKVTATLTEKTPINKNDVSLMCESYNYKSNKKK